MFVVTNNKLMELTSLQLFSAFMCVSVRLLVQSRHWNWILMTSVGLSILTYLVTMSIMQQVRSLTQGEKMMFCHESAISTN